MTDESDKTRSGNGCGTDEMGISAYAHLRVSPSPCLPFSVSPRLRVFVLLLTAHCLLFTVSCRQDMQDQPKMKPYRATAFFPNGMSSRPPVPGTVARGYLRADTEFFTGKKSGTQAGTPVLLGDQAAPTGTHAAQGPAVYPDDVEVFPLAITYDVVKRGKERYEIFCSACHGLTGNGDGMIVRRGFRRAASFNSDSCARLRSVITLTRSRMVGAPCRHTQTQIQHTIAGQLLPTFEHCS